jgi:hypothetical protein
MFYVYEHIRLDTNAIFYVGKGCGARICSKDKRNKHWQSIVNKAGYKGRVIVESHDEELVFFAEQERIDQLRKLGLKLANQTDGGGGGIKGYRHTSESRQLISKNVKGKMAGEKHPRYGLFGVDNPTYGRRQSAEAKHGMSINSSMKRPEIVAKISGEKSFLANSVEYEGKIYKTIKSLAEYLGISRQALSSRIFRGQSKKYGYKLLGKTKDLTPLQAAADA